MGLREGSLHYAYLGRSSPLIIKQTLQTPTQPPLPLFQRGGPPNKTTNHTPKRQPVGSTIIRLGSTKIVENAYWQKASSAPPRWFPLTERWLMARSAMHGSGRRRLVYSVSHCAWTTAMALAGNLVSPPPLLLTRFPFSPFLIFQPSSLKIGVRSSSCLFYFFSSLLNPVPAATTSVPFCSCAILTVVTPLWQRKATTRTSVPFHHLTMPRHPHPPGTANSGHYGY